MKRFTAAVATVARAWHWRLRFQRIRTDTARQPSPTTTSRRRRQHSRRQPPRLRQRTFTPSPTISRNNHPGDPSAPRRPAPRPSTCRCPTIGGCFRKSSRAMAASSTQPAGPNDPPSLRSSKLTSDIDREVANSHPAVKPARLPRQRRRNAAHARRLSSMASVVRCKNGMLRTSRRRR